MKPRLSVIVTAVTATIVLLIGSMDDAVARGRGGGGGGLSRGGGGFSRGGGASPVAGPPRAAVFRPGRDASRAVLLVVPVRPLVKLIPVRRNRCSKAASSDSNSYSKALSHPGRSYNRVGNNTDKRRSRVGNSTDKRRSRVGKRSSNKRSKAGNKPRSPTRELILRQGIIHRHRGTTTTMITGTMAKSRPWRSARRRWAPSGAMRRANHRTMTNHPRQ